MAEGDRAAADLAWAKEIACIAVEKLTSKRLLKPEEAVVAIEIVAEEIFVRLILGHRPWRQDYLFRLSRLALARARLE